MVFPMVGAPLFMAMESALTANFGVEHRVFPQTEDHNLFRDKGYCRKLI